MIHGEQGLAAWVDGDLWERVRSGDESARNTLSEQLNGLLLYDHVIPPYLPGQVAVSVTDLIGADIVRSVTLHKEIV